MLSNTKIKYIQTLYHKKKRDAEGLFIAEGVKIVNELLTPGILTVKEIFATAEWVQAHGRTNIPVTEVTEKELERISSLTTPNQALAIVQQPDRGKIPTTFTGLAVALDGIQDPGNLGTIIRTCDWFGVSNIICSEDCADLFNPKVIQATMGSFLRVNIYYTELEAFLAQQSMPVYAAVLNGKPVKDKATDAILLIGNESRGISAVLQPLCTHDISIERKGGAESLNAAVACGVLLAQLS